MKLFYERHKWFSQHSKLKFQNSSSVKIYKNKTYQKQMHPQN